MHDLKMQELGGLQTFWC